MTRSELAALGQKLRAKAYAEALATAALAAGTIPNYVFGDTITESDLELEK